jgi:hypothetical protein
VSNNLNPCLIFELKHKQNCQLSSPKVTEDDLGYTIEAIEKGSLVKGSNDNTNKMYGRIREDALRTIFDIMKLKPSDIFIDLGHGLGCPSVQAAYTRGCTSRGIELDGDRFFISEQLKNGLAHRKELLQQQDVDYVDVSE